MGAAINFRVIDKQIENNSFTCIEKIYKNGVLSDNYIKCTLLHYFCTVINREFEIQTYGR
jgi:hypothetical protein